MLTRQYLLYNFKNQLYLVSVLITAHVEKKNVNLSDGNPLYVTFLSILIIYIYLTIKVVANKFLESDSKIFFFRIVSEIKMLISNCYVSVFD